MAAAGLKKIKALTDGKYGIDGVGLFELDLADPIIKAVLRTTQNASLGIERQMAKLDRYMRLFYRATPFTLNAAMHAEDAGIAKIMDEFCKKDPEKGAAMMYQAMDFQEVLRSEWRETAEKDAQADSQDAHKLYAKKLAHAEKNEAKVAEAKALDGTWQFQSAEETRREIEGISAAGKRKDWLVAR